MGEISVRIENHPVLEYKRGEKITFFFNGMPVECFEGETIAAALYAANILDLSSSRRLHRPRGLFCAIGNCSSCLMEVDGVVNVKTCVTPARHGMHVCVQEGKGDLL